MGSGQRPTAPSKQSIFASPPPMAPAQQRPHLFSRLFHDDATAPLASPQLPPPAYPTTYSSQNVKPAGQGAAAACESPAKAPKKPCFLKVWMHDLKSGGTCSHGDGCGARQRSRQPSKQRFREPPAKSSRMCHKCQSPEKALLPEGLDS